MKSFVRQVTRCIREIFWYTGGGLAGLPEQVVTRAKQILSSLENGPETRDNDLSVEKNGQLKQTTEMEISGNTEPAKVVKVEISRPSQLELFRNV